jgi:hypothetical protein
MTCKAKSPLYFASFVIVAITYYNIVHTNPTVPTNEIANANIENAMTIEALN